MRLRALDLLVGSKLALGAYGDDAQQQLHWHFLLSVHLGSFVPSASDFFPALLQAPSSYLYREHRWRKCQNGTRAIADAGTEPAANGSCLKRASAAQLPRTRECGIVMESEVFSAAAAQLDHERARGFTRLRVTTPAPRRCQRP